MKINNYSQNCNNKFSNPNFGLNIQGSMPTTKLKSYFTSNGLPEGKYYEFLDKIRELAGDDFSIRFLRINKGKQEKGPVVVYKLLGKIPNSGEDGGYIQIKNKAGVKMKSILKKVSADIEAIRAKFVENASKAQIEVTDNNIKPANNKSYLNFLRKIVSKLFKKDF